MVANKRECWRLPPSTASAAFVLLQGLGLPTPYEIMALASIRHLERLRSQEGWVGQCTYKSLMDAVGDQGGRRKTSFRVRISFAPELSRGFACVHVCVRAYHATPYAPYPNPTLPPKRKREGGREGGRNRGFTDTNRTYIHDSAPCIGYANKQTQCRDACPPPHTQTQMHGVRR